VEERQSARHGRPVVWRLSFSPINADLPERARLLSVGSDRSQMTKATFEEKQNAD
jgi:hypothetical protein